MCKRYEEKKSLDDVDMIKQWKRESEIELMIVVESNEQEKLFCRQLR